MNFEHVKELLSEAMIVGEHPSEPMVIHSSVKLNEEFPFDQFSEATLYDKSIKFFNENPSLVGGYNLLDKNLNRVINNDLDKFVRELWSSNILSNNDFLAQSISIEGTCLIRFKLSREDGFSVAAHHALIDGRGIFNLTIRFLEYLLNDNIEHDTSKSSRVKKYSFFQILKSKILYFFQRFNEIKNPPVILGNKYKFESSSHAFYTHQFSYEKMKKAYTMTKNKNNGLTLNDFIMSLLANKINSISRVDDNERISFMMPVDLRRHGVKENYGNLSSGISINFFKNDFENFENLTKATLSQTKKYISNNFDLRSIDFIKLIRKLGILEESRNFLVSKGFPRRCFKGSNSFWKFSNTAIFANLGNIKINKSTRKYIKSLSGYPAIISPTSLAMTAFIYQDLYINFHSSRDIFNEDGLKEIAKTIDIYLDNLIKGEEICQ